MAHRFLLLAGSNMIPLEIFHSENSEEKYRRLLEDAVTANMNMIRVWGGGIYQDDSFYDLCDEMGLLVWQEAMFACSLYPANTAFLADVSPAPVNCSEGSLCGRSYLPAPVILPIPPSLLI